MAEDSRVALGIKIAAVCLTAAGLVWGAAQFLLTQRIEARSAYLEYQLATYKDAARVAAQLATLPADTPEHSDAMARFWELYWGELVLVEDPQVEARMRLFKDGLDTGSRHLPELAYCLSHSLRGSLARSWDVTDWAFSRPIPAENCEELVNAK